MYAADAGYAILAISARLRLILRQHSTPDPRWGMKNCGNYPQAQIVQFVTGTLRMHTIRDMMNPNTSRILTVREGPSSAICEMRCHIEQKVSSAARHWDGILTEEPRGILIPHLVMDGRHAKVTKARIVMILLNRHGKIGSADGSLHAHLSPNLQRDRRGK